MYVAELPPLLTTSIVFVSVVAEEAATVPNDALTAPGSLAT